jgi:hypothetical protein
MAAKLNQEVRKGDTFSRIPTYRTKSDRVGINITGATVSGGITSKTGVVTPFICTIINGPAGQFIFGLTALTTSSLEVGTYAMELKITFADATVQTLFTGNFVVTA